MNLKSYLKINLSALFMLGIAATSACYSQQTTEQQKQEKDKQTKGADKHTGHDQHFEKVNERGDHAMGFSHKKTTHRFRLLPTGGAIEVRTNSAEDKESLAQIRAHLNQISKAFSAGNFDAPFLTHGTIPPGVAAMKESGSKIDYKFEEIENGGRVIISTADAAALQAVHDFLRFQIEDHQTGDSTKIEKPH